MSVQSDSEGQASKFGTILGHGFGSVPVYSSDYDSADEGDLPDRHAYLSYIDNIYMGYKWQCVELARRCLYMNYGFVFEDVAMAYDIFSLDNVRCLKTQTQLPLKSFINGAKRPPEPGCLLIWKEGGEFVMTGHVAVVTEVFADRIRIIEQNVHDSIWPDGQHYSRELPASTTESGEYWIRCTYHDTEVLGWVIQTDNAANAEVIKPTDVRLLNLAIRDLPAERSEPTSWLDTDKADEAAYLEYAGGPTLTNQAELSHSYFSLSDTALKEIQRASTELHAFFMHATDHVLQSDELLAKFNIPQCLWAKIRNSWGNRKNTMITGRFDFTLSEYGLKLYEYNADSASCYLEAGKLQGKWAEANGVRVGKDAGKRLSTDLENAWRNSSINGVIHIMQDKDLEETYHARYMKSTMEQAGLSCKIITGVKDLKWAENGDIIDKDGIPIRWVWKTWAWETALDQLRDECDNDPELLKNHQPGIPHGSNPRLVDVLLRSDVMVFEPLWSLIPSNKAILPILWKLFPNNKYLLHSTFELDEHLKNKGYVKKPIVGRCGENIKMFDADQSVLEKSDGRFAAQDYIYQELFSLPKIHGFNTQLCTFTVDGRYSAACTRVDSQLIIRSGSDIIPLRVLPDSLHLSSLLVDCMR